MTGIITVPVTRAVDRALRMLQLTYQMMVPHRGTTAADALRQVAGYSSTGEPTQSAARKFEHDKKGMRSIGIPIVVQAVSDPPASCYKVRARDLMMPVPPASRGHWVALQAVAQTLQQVADRLPTFPPALAGPLTTVLLALCEDLALRVPSWKIPQGMLGHGPTLLEWLHSVFYIVAKRGRMVQEWGGSPVSLDTLTARTGLSADLLWLAAQRCLETRTAVPEGSHLMRVVSVSRSEGLSILAPNLKSPWRPRLAHIDALIDTATSIGHQLSVDGVQALREMARGRPVIGASAAQGALA